MAEKKFAIRFSVEDMEKVRAALKGMGDDGASALRAIERQSRQATPGLKALDTAAKDVRAEFDAFANRIPIIGGALSALGPIGTGVAAGLGGIVLGFTAMSNASRQATEDISRIKDAADRLNLSAVDLQSIRGVGMLSGINADEMDAMLATLATNSARASEGFGKMKAALDRVNPELSRQLATSTSQAERMDVLARATQEATTYNEKLNIAVAAFGTEGGKMIAMLDESGAAMDTWKERARGAGLVLEEDLVKAVEAYGDRMDALRSRSELAGKRLAVAFAPFDEWLEGVKARATDNWADVFAGEAFKAIEDQSSSYLQRQIEQYRHYIDELHRTGMYEGYKAGRGPDWVPSQQLEIDKREAVLRSRWAKEKADAEAVNAKTAEANLVADGEAFGAWLENWYVDLQRSNKDKADKAVEEAKKRADEAAKLREQQEKAAIEIRASLGDHTGKLAAEEARLNALVEAGVLSRETATASLAKTRAELDGSAAAVERWKSAIASALTPVQQAEAALATFEAEVRKFGDQAGVNELAVRAGLVDAINDAEQAAREATPEFKAVADARAAIAAEAERMMSVEDRVQAYAAKTNAVIGVADFQYREAAQAIAIYRAQLEATALSQQTATFEVQFAAATLDSIFDENMNSLEDLGKVALRVFRDMAVNWIMMNQQMAASQGFAQFIGNALAAPFAGMFGGSAAPSATPAEASANFGAGYGIYHTGGNVGSTPVATRWAQSDIFAGAQRFHTGTPSLRAGERAIIAEDGERILSRVDNARVVRAIESGGGGGAPRVELHFHGVEKQPEVRQSQNSDGSLRLDVMMRDAALGALASPAGAKVMRDQYGINRAVGG